MDTARMERLIEKSYRLRDAGVTFAQIEARQAEINRLGKADPDFTEVDFNAALEELYRDTFINVVQAV